MEWTEFEVCFVSGAWNSEQVRASARGKCTGGAKQGLRRIRGKEDQTKNVTDVNRRAPHCCDLVHDDKTLRVESVDC